MGGGALSSDYVSKLGSKEVSKKLRNFSLAIKKACHCEDERSEDVAIAKSLNINEITTQSSIARNDTNRHPELVSGSQADTVFSRFTSHFSRKRVAFTLAEGATHVDTCDGKRKIAFTLAEVLITIGVIGVVASLTLPSVIQNYKKQVTVAKLQKAYSVLNQAFQNSVADNGPSENWQEADEIGVREYFNTYWKKYFKKVDLCANYKECGYSDSAPFSYLNGEKCFLALTPERVYFKTLENYVFIFTDTTGEIFIPHIYIDINGAKQPNKLGIDVFMFERISGKGILPYGYELPITQINASCNVANRGSYCARKIMSEGWQISDDYPWW